MATIPTKPKIYHITHLRNLPQIVERGVLWSDAKRIELGLDCTLVGLSDIKRRRLHEIEVLPCHPGTKVGDYVPFYFCPRSIMLYILHKGNLEGLKYKGGQRPILHLQADMHAVVDWAERKGRRWAFSDTNAGARYVDFFNDLGRLDEINWAAVNSSDFRDAKVKDGKQAEFLVYRSFPWELIEKIGVHDAQVLAAVQKVIAEADHQPLLRVETGWYY